MTANATDTQGRYVQGVAIIDGTIVVTFGMAAHDAIAGRVLTHRPYRTAEGNVGWACGYAAPPQGLAALGKGGVAAVTTIDSKYLPSACR
jgi:hypothetical protein